MFTDIFKDGSLQEYIIQNTQDPWVGTNFEGYVFMSPKQKGEFGERFVHKYMELLEYRLERAATSTAGHDRIVLQYLEEVMTSRYLTEIKFSLACRDKKDKTQVNKDQFIINPYIHGGRGVVVNTTGCDPVDRGFDPLRPPQICARSSIG